MSLVYSVFVPHPPILIPEIGKGEERKCQASLTAYQEVAQRLVQANIETTILISPHAPLAKEGITVLTDDPIQGNFAQFGAPHLSFSWVNDLVLLSQFQKNLPGVIPIQGRLDHGAMVPLYFLQKNGWDGKVVLLGMPLAHPEEYGFRLGQILDQLPGRYALVASGDLSHRLQQDGPYGFDPAGPEFDQAVLNALQKDTKKIASLPADLVQQAGECGYRSLRLALAAKEGAPEVLSYEGPFGVGYLVADLYHSSPLAQWARRYLSAHLQSKDCQTQHHPHSDVDPDTDSAVDLDADSDTDSNLDSKLNLEVLLPPTSSEFAVRRGCFVTLKQNGQLRGCIGTTEPWQANLALEIQHNALAAATQDPRFPPVKANELDSLNITVDVLGELEKIDGPEELDPWRYGVVVHHRGRTGLLLPHLEGVDTVTDQIRIAKQKAGISPQEPIELWRFEVKRHYE